MNAISDIKMYWDQARDKTEFNEGYPSTASDLVLRWARRVTLVPDAHDAITSNADDVERYRLSNRYCDYI